ncbi:MAG: two pore domain potassium channel family protein [Arenimonas sp.]|nr:two pore domain potassium channel family protein [Arenimonas sp.]MBP7981656.1 two pore domain potassium channel family protein [Arenimonas sp.]
MTTPERLARNNIILLICLLALVLLYPLFEVENSMVRDLLITAILFSGVYSLEFSAHSRKLLLPLAWLTVITTWTNHFINTNLMTMIDFGTTSLTLAVIVVLMIRHIAKSRVVTRTIILNAINGYILLGVVGAALFNIANGAHILLHGAGSAGIQLPDGSIPQFSDYLYLSFITLTTVGYGDITPVSHMTRPISMLIGLSGQLYMTILIAMLIGKFLAGNQKQ